ncbi:GspH/FimT family pseudopilin [Psychromonas sp.]|nr:GspH/FimT family pseudopilin [Psychromonas sp.]
MRTIQGFTFLEMVIVMIISSLLLTIGIPGFTALIKGNRLLNVGSSIQTSLMFARSQSVSLMSYVTVCPLVGNSCSNNWINGLDIFIDNDQDQVLGVNDTKLKAADPFNNLDTLVFPTSSVTFTPDGQITGSASLFRYCTDEERIAVSIAFSGRAKIVTDEDFTDCL